MIMGKGQVDCFRRRGEKHKRDVDIHPARHRIWCILFLIFKIYRYPLIQNVDNLTTYQKKNVDNLTMELGGIFIL
jgi:hypothetical protein